SPCCVARPGKTAECAADAGRRDAQLRRGYAEAHGGCPPPATCPRHTSACPPVDLCVPLLCDLCYRRGLCSDSSSSSLRIEPVAQAVAQEVEAEHERRDREAGENRQVRRVEQMRPPGI